MKALLNLILLMMLTSSVDAHCYPGAKAEDYHKKFEIKSVCTSGSSWSNILYLYTEARIIAARGGCPEGAVAQIATDYVPIADLMIADKEGFEARAVGRWKEKPIESYTQFE